ncbi:hypothetical protein HPG69_007239, partial [Diceros bicornis minor]
IISSPCANTVSALTGEMIITPQQGGEITEPKPLSQVQLLNGSDAAPAPTVPTANVNWNPREQGKLWAAIACEARQFFKGCRVQIYYGAMKVMGMPTWNWELSSSLRLELGNSSLLCLYNFTLLTGYKLRSTDQILNQLVLANNLALFSRGIPQTMAAFGLKYFLDDVGVIGPRNSKNLSVKTNYGYCSSLMPDRFISFLQAVILSSIDAMCVGFMLWTGGYMMFVLHRHKQQVQHIHNSRLSARPSHEARATCTILILVSFFSCSYCIFYILTLCVTLSMNPGHWLVDTSPLIASCFPTLSPFVLISSDTRVSQFFFDFCTRKNFFPHLVQQL